MKQKANLSHVGEVLRAAEEYGLSPFVLRDAGSVTVCVPDADPGTFGDAVSKLTGVSKLGAFETKFKLVSREFRATDTVVPVGPVRVGGPGVVFMAGPCAVESKDQLFAAAEALAASKAHILRGGAFKPRSSPYAFQGLKEEGLRILSQARGRFGLPVVTEVISPNDVPLVAEHADLLQVGARNMQNYPLLEALGTAGRPVLLKRGMMSTIEELLLSAEYVVAAGNPDVILCERGIRTFSDLTRNTLDVTAVAVLKHLSHLPVLVDPSHATGLRQYVAPAARAGIAAGADGLIVEVHPRPEEALCDGGQSLTLEGFRKLRTGCLAVAHAVGRT
jgi:3-deoxy-7-phosphoheptulonate synthase